MTVGCVGKYRFTMFLFTHFNEKSDDRQLGFRVPYRRTKRSTKSLGAHTFLTLCLFLFFKLDNPSVTQ